MERTSQKVASTTDGKQKRGYEGRGTGRMHLEELGKRKLWAIVEG